MNLTVDEHEERIHDVLTHAFEGGCLVPVENHTSLDEMMEQNPDWEVSAGGPAGPYAYPSEEQPDLELMALKRQEAAEVATWAREQLVRWLIGDGLHPFPIMQRLYCLLYARYEHVTGSLSGRFYAAILNQGRAAFSAAMKRLFGIPSREALGAVVKVNKQKRRGTEAYAANAAHNLPRRQLDDELEAPPAMTPRERAQRLHEARAAADARQLAADAADMDSIKQANRERHAK